MSPAKSRKSQICDAAIQCFSRYGYYRTSFEQIADVAGITKAGIYYHFKSKKDLFIALFLDKANSFFDQIMSSVQTKNSVLEQVTYLFGNECNSIPLDTEIVEFCTEFMTVSMRDRDIREVVTDFYHNKIDAIATIIQKGVDANIFRDIDAHAVARNLYFQSWGYFLISATISDDCEPTGQHAVNMDIFLRGLEKHKS